MATKKTATYRTDLLDHAMNAGKEDRVHQHRERFTSAADPRLTNPYFKKGV
jgi:hypothetical protein